MVCFYDKLNSISFSSLMSVYEESNLGNARERYPEKDQNAALLLAEQDFYAYLADVFFKTRNARYAIFEDGEKYCCAVRMEPYLDGLLFAGLETAPAYRGAGYASLLLTEVLSKLHVPVYSHVARNNLVSLKLHMNCGFRIIKNCALYLDGSLVETAYTLCFRPSVVEKDIDK